MPKIQNSFLKGKMNKDLDERLVPKGEYREAQNILITQSEGSDVGAVENIEGNSLAVPRPSLYSTVRFVDPPETIGYYADTLNKRAFWFVTNFTGDNGDIRTMSRAQASDTCQILMADLNDTSAAAKIIVEGHFLNFSKDHLITGVNLIDDLLFWTDNYNQPRKINVTNAIENVNYYTLEEQISVAKVAPYLTPILYDSTGAGDEHTLTNDETITSDFLKDRFVRFSYRYKYEDGEYTTMAPFTQIIFRPLNRGHILNVLSTDTNETDVQDVYSKTTVDIMKNHYNKIDIRIPLPSNDYETDAGVNFTNNLHIVKIEVLIKESDEDVVKVVKEIDVNTNESFLNQIETTPVFDTLNDVTLYRHVYKHEYNSEDPYKILEDKQITRVFDQVPLRAKAQEISGNRIIYGNFTENYNLPIDNNGKSGVNYVISNTSKGDTEVSLNNKQYNNNIYKYHSVKQRREYQVGIILADKFGRQSPVILSTNNQDTINIPNVSQDLSNNYTGGYSWSEIQASTGKALTITFNETDIVEQAYNGDINSETYNPYGWYSYKIVVKQQGQEYHNIYTSHPADSWNNESNGHDEVLGFTWVSLYGNNINKITKDLTETSEVREDVAGSDSKIFPKVIKDINSSEENISTFGAADQDPIEIMSLGTAREQGILTRDDRDKDRVHDFVMAKRNPLLAQVKSIGTNNRVRFRVDATVKDANTEDLTHIIIGDGNTINPYIRVGHEITINQPRDLYHLSNIGRKVLDVRIKISEQNGFTSKTITLDGSEIDNSGGDAVLEVGQLIEFQLPFLNIVPGSSQVISTLPGALIASSHSASENFITTTTGAGAWSNAVKPLIEGAYNAGIDAETIYVVNNQNLPIPPPTVDIVATVEHEDFNGNTPKIFFNEPEALFTAAMIQGSSIFFGTAEQISGDNILGGKTTATIEEHGDHFNIRRPILQKVELNKKENRSILHFDRNVFENLQVSTATGFMYLAMYDPITVKSIETITETIDGVLKYYQKIKLSHEVFFSENDDIVIQNLETEPISVRRGLTVLETEPFKSNINIFYETSTSGLISDLHRSLSSFSQNSLEISYFNTFILTGGGDFETNTRGKWHVEESRIKGEFNGKSVDYGVRAHLVDDEYAQRTRGNALIHSGIFNAKTKVNKTNEFSIGESITKAVDIIHGGIQKLYAEDTNLIIFQENKVSRALIDKDAIFTAEGQPLTTASKVVIGQVGSFAGEYGISKNPESFAVYNGRKYFSDKERGAVLRLSQDGITPISDAGMRSFFRDNLSKTNRVYGMYDERKNKYVISLQSPLETMTVTNELGGYLANPGVSKQVSKYATLSFDEASKGWVSFYTYQPTFGFSLSNEFYTYNLESLWKHYSKDVQRCNFYSNADVDPANIEFVFNDQPSTVKNFHTISYEGTTGWKMASAETDMHLAFPVLSSDTSVSVLSIPVNFINKENKYYGHLRNNTLTTALNQVIGVDLSGIKGYFNKVKMQYWKPSEAIASSVSKAELYAVGSETVYSSQ